MTVQYTLDPRQSRFTVQAFAKGMLSAFAHSPTFAIRDFAGEVQYSPDGPAVALRIVVKAESLTVIDNVKPRDRQEIEGQMHREVLETARYPEITFQSTEIAADKVADNWYRLRLRGELSLHGLTRLIQLEGQLRVFDDGVRLSGEFPLSQSAFGIKPVTALGGMISLKDELKFSFDFVCWKAA